MLGRDRERWGGRRNVGRRRTDGQEFDGEGCGEEEPGVFSFVHGREGGREYGRELMERWDVLVFDGASWG